MARSKVHSKLFLWLSIISSLFIITLQFFQWKLVEMFTVFVMPFVWLFLYIFFLVVFILSIIRLFKKKEWKPLFIQAITIVLLLFIPFNQVALNVDFKLNKSERNEVISKIQDGTYKPNVSHNNSLIHLPDDYTDLSKGGGDIIVEKEGEDYSILFFTFRGVLDNFSGFVFSPNDKKPHSHLFGGDFKEVVKMEENWYFVSSS